MSCYLCEREAVDRCFTCGQLFCELHGKMNCQRCATGIAPGSGRDDRISALLLARNAKPGWWRPQPAEDFEPPACHECKALARRVCSNCGNRYCPEHAGKNGWCAACVRSARLGNLYLTFVFSLVGILAILSWWHLHGQ